MTESGYEVRPTLFIALGNTGSRVGLHLRKRLLAASWREGQRIERLADFPLARFIRFHLSDFQVWERGLGPAQPEASFRVDEIISGPFDPEAELDSPNVAKWSPLTSQTMKRWGIEPMKCHRIRSFSRLYCLTQAEQVRARVRQALHHLHTCDPSQDAEAQRLGLNVSRDRINIVIIASAAGSYGSGSFLQIGDLVRQTLAEQNIPGRVALHLVLAGGAMHIEPERAQAHSYAALMELETRGRGYTTAQDDNPVQPFDDLYVFDTCNLAQRRCEEPEDLPLMLGDMLFNDLANPPLSEKKWIMSSIHRQYTIRSHRVELPEEFENTPALLNPMSYSSQGHAELYATYRPDGLADLHLSGHAQTLLSGLMAPQEGEDPLLALLAGLTAQDLRRVLSLWLEQAMPWANLELEPGRGTNPHGYLCLLSVPQPAEFRRLYGKLLSQCLPALPGLRPNDLQFIDCQVPGRLVASMRLSGFALNALRDLPDYLANYRKQAQQRPLHVNKHANCHPLIFDQAHYLALARDLRLYLQAIALGELTRNPGQAYELIDEREAFGIGTEPAIRQYGLRAPHRQLLSTRVQERLSHPSPALLAALDALFEHYRYDAYQSLKVIDEQGVVEPACSLPRELSAILGTECVRLLRRQAPEHAEALREQARTHLLAFTHSISGSKGDVYVSEVVPHHGEKLQLRPECFDPGWLEALFNPGIQAAQAAAQHARDSQARYHLNVGGVEYGPYSFLELQHYVSTGQITRQSWLWRPGLSEWFIAETQPELANLFTPPAAPPNEPPMPG